MQRHETKNVSFSSYKNDVPFGIEPNEHRISCFQGKYGYHTDLPENPERPHSPNVLPMSRAMLGVGFFGSVFLVGIEENGGIEMRIL